MADRGDPDHADRPDRQEGGRMSVQRRSLLRAMPGVALASAMAPAQAADVDALTPPSLSLAFRLRVLIGPPQELGMVNGVRKRVIPITGGTVEGPRLQGRVLPGGADWQSIRADGTADILARYTLEAQDGTLISVTNPGYRHGPPEVLARIAAGQVVDPALYYFRTTPRFDVESDSVHGWLGRTVFLCTAGRYSDHVRLDIFAIS
ncbi:DUF3237 domain-containing protein [Sphingobium naphthae]|uniref:UPF0311 protein O0R41_15305 n=1 Tax=Sphingobium naphthae TaxID=1886786 RepID=A0ABU4A068_9SPHN|nr:DUF3237 domain-containing protein [Sphingobium naphthae]MDV5824972.1 DUF3237 domain-containing protein [Sphingobium naphthae]